MSTDQDQHDAFAHKEGTAGDRNVPILRAGLLCRCPRCGEGALFSGFLTVAPQCSKCLLDYSAVDSGDGPVVFIILIVGFIVTFAALAVETTFAPPYWVHVVLWLPMILILSLALLRPFKATLVAMQYRHGAREGRRHEG